MDFMTHLPRTPQRHEQLGHFVKLHFHNNLKNVLSGHIWILHSLSFPTVPKTPKTEFG